MSGKALPYSLRPNKAVDRNLFLELLAHLDAFMPIADYEYIGMGGPYLDDFRLVHSQFAPRSMISFDSEEDVVRRQEFNRPFASVTCLCHKSGKYIATFERSGPTIFWLDYTTPNRGEQFQEFQMLLSKLASGDIVRVTLNANHESLGGNKLLMGADELAIARLDKLRATIGDFVPQDLGPSDITAARLPSVLGRALVRAAQDILVGHKYVFIPLACFCYADGQTMLTLTGILLDPDSREELFKLAALDRWPHLCGADLVPERIDVPFLSARERLFIDQNLPTSDERLLLNMLNFLCAEDEELTLSQLRSYRLFYRYYPFFSRVLI